MALVVWERADQSPLPSTCAGSGDSNAAVDSVPAFAGVEPRDCSICGAPMYFFFGRWYGCSDPDCPQGWVL